MWEECKSHCLIIGPSGFSVGRVESSSQEDSDARAKTLRAASGPFSPQGYRILNRGNSGKNRLQDVAVPASLQALASNRAFFHGSVQLQNSESDSPEHGSNLWAVSPTDPALALAERDVQ